MSQLIADLIDFGLTPLQSRVYVTLLRLRESRAGQLSLAAGVVRPEVYRILRELASQGLVQRSPGSPSSYAATVPNRAISMLLDRHRQKLATLEQKGVSLVNSLSSEMPYFGEQIEARFSLITGVTNVLRKERQMITDAKHEYEAVISRDGLERMPDDIVAPAISSARKRRLHVRVVSEVSLSNVAGAKFLAQYTELRCVQGLSVYVDIVDQREVLFGPAVSRVETTSKMLREADIWTNNLRFVTGMHALFEAIWQKASPFAPNQIAQARRHRSKRNRIN